MSEYQSTYRKFHSSENALLRVQNDILVPIDSGHFTALLLLNLSAAFNTIDHNILLHHFKHCFGISCSALSSLSPFLANSFQTVVASNSKSQLVLLEFGIPQGNILGPLFYCISVNHPTPSSPNTLASVVISTQIILKYIFHFSLNMHHPPYLFLSLASKFSPGW